MRRRHGIVGDSSYTQGGSKKVSCCRNVEIRVAWGSYGSIYVIGNVTIRSSASDFLFEFNRNHASILYCFRDTAVYLSKVADFYPPHLHLAPPYGLILVEFRGDFGHQKTRVSGLSCYRVRDVDGSCAKHLTIEFYGRYAADIYTYYYVYSVTPSLLHSGLKTFLFCESFHFFSSTDYMDSRTVY